MPAGKSPCLAGTSFKRPVKPSPSRLSPEDCRPPSAAVLAVWHSLQSVICFWKTSLMQSTSHAFEDEPPPPAPEPAVDEVPAVDEAGFGNDSGFARSAGSGQPTTNRASRAAPTPAVRPW